MADANDIRELEKDPRLFLYTSLTSGSSQIVTATSRMELILKANKLPFLAIDIATDEKARRLWQRRGANKKLPGLVKEGFVLGDIEDVEDWNEFGELKENVGPVPATHAGPDGGRTGINIAATLPGTESDGPEGSLLATGRPVEKPQRIALPGMAEVAAMHKAKAEAARAEKQSVLDDPVKAETSNSASDDKKESIEAAKEKKESIKFADEPKELKDAHEAKEKEAAESTAEEAEDETAKPTEEAEPKPVKQHPNLDHLSAPASRIHSGTATPAETTLASSPPNRASVTSPIEEDAVKSFESTEPRTVDALLDRPSSHQVTSPELKSKSPESSTAATAASAEAPTKSIGELQLDDSKDTSKEDAKDEDAASKTVGD